MSSVNGRPTPPAFPDPPNDGSDALIFIAPVLLASYANMIHSKIEENKRLKLELALHIQNRKEAERMKTAGIERCFLQMDREQKLEIVQMRKAENKYRRMVEPFRKRIMRLQRKKLRCICSGQNSANRVSVDEENVDEHIRKTTDRGELTLNVSSLFSSDQVTAKPFSDSDLNGNELFSKKANESSADT